MIKKSFEISNVSPNYPPNYPEIAREVVDEAPFAAVGKDDLRLPALGVVFDAGDVAEGVGDGGEVAAPVVGVAGGVMELPSDLILRSIFNAL